EALTGEVTGLEIGELTGLEVRIRDSVWKTEGWMSLVLSLLKNPPSKHLVFEEPELDNKKRSRADHDKKSVKKQKPEEDDAKKKELRACLDIVSVDDIAINVESLATKYLIVYWKPHTLTENMMYYQIVRANGSSKNYKILTEMCDDFDRQDIIDLYRLVKKGLKTKEIEDILNMEASWKFLFLIVYVLVRKKIEQVGAGWYNGVVYKLVGLVGSESGRATETNHPQPQPLARSILFHLHRRTQLK
nr:hypothetical protein [Tanacetum cinerariifolium]